jgi:DNA-binding response OmpR family regulator
MINEQERLVTRMKTILVVEDDETIAEVIRLALAEEPSYDTLLVHTPEEALKTVAGVIPDLFIIDYRLSYMDGITLYDKLHAIAELHHVPAIITSASLDHYQDELEARNLTGLEKPFDLDMLLATVKKVAG